MPLEAIVVSRDRPAQLDLLLRSVTCHAPDLFDGISVLWRASDSMYTTGYGICVAEHPSVDFYQESNFQTEIDQLVYQSPQYVSFLTDDSYFYRQQPEVDPCAVMSGEPDVLCFSLRLGQNTGICYPLRGRLQSLPAFVDGGGYLMWEWGLGDADFCYPGSLDGHIFRKENLLQFIRSSDDWWNPNTLEDVLCRAVYGSGRSSMACFERSILVGIPANRTSESHPGNRFGERYFTAQEWLNSQFLNGERILFPNIHQDSITAAHQELGLEFN